MSKIAFVFPGQGAQETGMGMDLIETSAEAKAMFEAANDVLDFDLINLCKNEDELINQTAYTQPALVAVSICLLNELKKNIDITPDYVAGLSLGEYSALVANGVLDYVDAIKLVRQRGLLMEKAGSETQGAMAAIVKGKADIIKAYCDEDEGIVQIANYNSPVQVVISGEKDAVARVSERLTADKTRVIPLNVSGAFHSPLMDSAATAFESVLQDIELKDIQIPYLTNVTGELVKDPSIIKELLVQQLKGSVMWEKSVENMIEDGVTTFVEIGPGKTLAGLIKKINRKVTVLNLDSMESVNIVVNQLKGE